MFEYDTTIEVGSYVKIREISVYGMVRAIRIDSNGVTFLVTYWLEKKLQEVWLTEPELQALSGNPPTP